MSLQMPPLSQPGVVESCYMPISDIERGLVARYMVRVLERGDLPLRATRQLLGWMKERSSSLGLPMPKQLGKAIGNMYTSQYRISELEAAYATHRDYILKTLHEAASETPRPEPVASNIELLVKELNLPDAAWKITGLIASYTRYEQVEYLCDAIGEVAGPITRTAAYMVGEPTRTIEQLMSPLGEIVGAGLLQIKDHGDQLAGTTGRYTIPWRIDLCLDQNYADFAEMRQTLLGTAHEAMLDASDYDHVAFDRDLVTGVLQGADREGARGVNILLYGPPGSGKTELTKMAAAKAGLALYSAGEEFGMIDKESDRSDRLSDLVFALRLLAGANKTALLFDEMEDVAWQLIRRGGSKLYLNRILENNPVPVLWTSNNINEIDPAVLRRMTLAVELKKPPARQREKILKKLDARIGVGLSDENITGLAQRVDATPAVLENALKAARFSRGGHEAVERAALGIVRAISGVTARRSLTPPDFDIALTCANMDLKGLTDRLTDSGRLGFSLVLSGAPGTGKSAFARYLAGHLGLDVMHKRASDLLGAFVGESEKRIADTFEQAREQRAFLIFDEAESFLFDRQDAVRSWEITQVNEMLTWMEDHPLPICCTTNMMDRFDRASLRRFTFHVRFNFLDRQALSHAYEVFFQIRKIPQKGLELANLTPGDFAQARRQARVLGYMAEPVKVVELLTEISIGKPGAHSAIGFVK